MDLFVICTGTQMISKQIAIFKFIAIILFKNTFVYLFESF